MSKIFQISYTSVDGDSIMIQIVATSEHDARDQFNRIFSANAVTPFRQMLSVEEVLMDVADADFDGPFTDEFYNSIEDVT